MYAAQLWLDPNKATFKGQLTIDVTINEPLRVLWLNAEKIELESAEWMNGSHGALKKAVKVATSSDHFLGLDLGETVPAGPIKLVLRYTGQSSGKDFSGAFVQEEEGHNYMFTQFEALGARRVFPSFDQPEFKNPWRITIHTPKGNLAFANTPEESVDEKDGMLSYRFAETKPLPSYLVAFAVGPFSVVDLGTAGRNRTVLRAIVPKGRENQTGYAKANMAKILTELENYFDLAYPYAKLDSVALPTFFGAMENPGLITYASGILLVEPGKESQRFKESHFNVVAHEIAHQWFGNLVTLRWWNDIWLNEAFATWLAAKTTNALHPEWNGDIKAVGTRDGVMAQDSLASARRIRQKIRTQADISAAFDGITYQKGGAVISMFETWVGADKFRQAMREYMRTHAWKTTTDKDFLTSLAKVSDAKLVPAFSTFLDQSGVPVVTVSLKCDGATASLDLAQSRYVPTGSKANANDGLWNVPVCLKYGSRNKSFETCELMTAKTQTMKLDEKAGCSNWLLGNAGSRGYYRVVYGGDLTERLLKANKKLSTAERIGVIGDISSLMGAGKIEVGAALSLVPRFVKDKNPQIIASAAAIAGGVSEMVPKRLQANYERFLGKTFSRQARRLGWKTKPNDTRETKALRSSLVPMMANDGFDRILQTKAGQLAKKWLTDRKAIDRDMLAPTLVSAAKNGDADLYGKFFAEAKATKDNGEKSALLAALGAFPQKKLMERSLNLLRTKDFPLRSIFGVFQGVMSDPKRRQAAYDYIKKHYDDIAAQLPPMAQGFLAFSAVPFCDEEHKADATQFFGKKAKEAGGGDRVLIQVVEAIDLCIAQRKQQVPGLTKFLKRY